MEKILYLLISSCSLFIMWSEVSGQCNTHRVPCKLTCHCNTSRMNCLPDHVMGCGDLGCQPGWSGPTCQKQNIAFSSRDVDSSNELNPDSRNTLAFDGDLNTVFRSLKQANPYVVVRTQSQVYAEVIHGIRISNGAADLNDISGFEIYVSVTSHFINSKLCYKDNTTTGQPEYVINCTQPVIGPYVRLTVPRTTTLAIREMEIYRCERFWFGGECDRLCNCRRGDENCDPITGSCEYGCKWGFHGSDCYAECPVGRFGIGCKDVCHCKNESSCSKADGTCDPQGCAAGFQGDNCQRECFGYEFGEGCRGTCHCDNSRCNTTTGHCPSGCGAGYKGDNCQQKCETGRFGLNCVKFCHCKNQSSCNKVNGRCNTLGCEPGYHGITCGECPKGHFGEDCRYTCHCVNPASCNHANGTCDEHGCAKGYKGDNCQDVCSKGRFGEECQHDCHCKNVFSCNHANGTCDEDGCWVGYKGDNCQDKCSKGLFGQKCQSSCHCKNAASCNYANGTCDEHGCAKGYKGDNCQEECSRGHFGYKCQQDCHCKNVFSCNHASGVCDEDGCAAGYKGDACQKLISGPTDSRVSSDLLTGVIVLALICLVLMMYAAIVTIRVRRLYRRLQQNDTSRYAHMEASNMEGS